MDSAIALYKMRRYPGNEQGRVFPSGKSPIRMDKFLLAVEQFAVTMVNLSG